MTARLWLCAMLLAAAGPGCATRTLPAQAPVPAAIRSLVGYKNYTLQDRVFDGEVQVLEAGPQGAPTLLLVHGLGDQAMTDWYPVLPALAADFHVVAFDLPGFGRSTHATELYAPQRYVQFIQESIRPALPGPFHLAGHSLGGALSLAYAAAHPEAVHRLVLIDVAGMLHRDSYAPFALHAGLGSIPGVLRPAGDMASTLARLVTQPLADTLPDPGALLQSAVTRRAVLRSPSRIAALALILDNFGPRIEAVGAPTLLLWGGHDAIAPLRTAHLLRARLPHARLHILEASGHEPARSEPDAVARLIARHLLGAADEPPLAAPERHAARTARCERQHGVTFQGEYDSVHVHGCTKVRLLGVRTGAIDIRDSEVMMQGGRVSSKGTAMTIHGSRVELTACDIDAETGMEAGGSELDLAGVHLVTRGAAVRADAATRIVFSVSKLQSAHTRGYLHGTRHLASESEL